jgi:hypothetical protein
MLSKLSKFQHNLQSTTIKRGLKQSNIKPMRPVQDLKRWSLPWVKDKAIVFLVFGITGSTTVSIVRPTLSLFGVTGSFIDGPWTYRVSYLAISLPLYSAILITVGTLFGRGEFFRGVSKKMYSRFIPKRFMK